MSDKYDLPLPNECPRCEARATSETGLVNWGIFKVVECLCSECGLIYRVAPHSVLGEKRQERKKWKED
jgi:hypothetical protein